MGEYITKSVTYAARRKKETAAYTQRPTQPTIPPDTASLVQSRHCLKGQGRI